MKKNEIIDKIQTELSKSKYEGVLLFGLDNIRYVSGAVFPFLGTLRSDRTAVLFRRNGEPVMIAPAWLKDTFRSGGSIRNVQVYNAENKAGTPASFEDALAALLVRCRLEEAKIGISENRISSAFYTALKKQFKKADFVSCDQWISSIRMVKTAYEQELLSEAAGKTDHGLSAAAHHVMVYASRPEKGLSEIIRVHCIERGLDMTGYESLAIGASGKHACTSWPEAPYFGVGLGKYLKENEIVRMEIRTNLNGYWSDAARMLTMGQPTDAQAVSYKQVVLIREKALEILRPGVLCSEAAEVLLKFCRENSIPVVKEHGFGHGIGVMPVEPPFIDPSDSEVLKAGMVLVINPTVAGPEGEFVRSYDTVIIEEDSARLIGWYKNWNEPYKAVLSYQHGGG